MVAGVGAALLGGDPPPPRDTRLMLPADAPTSPPQLQLAANTQAQRLQGRGYFLERRGGKLLAKHPLQVNRVTVV